MESKKGQTKTSYCMEIIARITTLNS
jgi:hypothetical protein